MPSRKPTQARKASGENIGEWQRRTVALKLRLRPEVAETIRQRAAAEEMTASSYVERLVTQDAQIV